MIEVDQIYHLACPASPPHYQVNPIKTVKTSVLGTINMLGLAKRTKARFLLTSTSGNRPLSVLVIGGHNIQTYVYNTSSMFAEIYGDPEQHPQKETYWGHVNPIGPRACYDEVSCFSSTIKLLSFLQSSINR